MTGRRLLADVNTLAIQLVDDHPGHPYVAEELVPALAGEDTLLVFGYLPLRVQWILQDLGFDTVDARNAVSSMLGYPMEFVDADDDTLLDAYEISAEKNHDVFDCFYLSLAREADADALLTTDRDFEQLCADESVDYLNPVPEDVLAEFHDAGE
ncbi:type II toxin-antitoxin system VapC family toxin [Halorarum halobium]|uniref:type II toxin-antitoxin system VapC family toxin n=1 Tax=Halorarum halobium TaxID=3075121 RepID=UPI0028B212B9|nr:PIN domain-containing protein [Halobaculum sp. XH14]